MRKSLLALTLALASLFAFLTGCADVGAADIGEHDEIAQLDQSLAVITLPTQVVDRLGIGWRKGEGALIAKRATTALAAEFPEETGTEIGQRCADVVELPLEAPEGEPSWFNILRGSVLVVNLNGLKNRFENAYPDTEFSWPENEGGGLIPRRLRDLLLGGR